MQHTIQNLFGAMPPNELPKKIELEGIPDVEVYYPAHAPEDETINWYNEPFKVKAMRWNERAPSFWLQWKFRTNMGWLNGKELTPERSQQIDDHSPDGFAWGYGGSGPAQLALAVCVELYGAALGYRVYQDFKFRFVAAWKMDKRFKRDIDLEQFNMEVVIPAMERLKNDLQYQLDAAKAELEFLDWLPSNADNNVSKDWLNDPELEAAYNSAKEHKRDDNGKDSFHRMDGRNKQYCSRMHKGFGRLQILLHDARL